LGKFFGNFWCIFIFKNFFGEFFLGFSGEFFFGICVWPLFFLTERSGIFRVFGCVATINYFYKMVLYKFIYMFMVIRKVVLYGIKTGFTREVELSGRTVAQLPVYLWDENRCLEYGLSYNWYSAIDSRNIANVGWVVPSEANIYSLLDYLADDLTAGGKLKETGLTYWSGTNIGATNEVGFNGRGHGSRDSNGTFTNLGSVGQYWTTKDYDPNARVLTTSNNTAASVRSAAPLKISGVAIRLLKTNTALSHGQKGTYIGNDGKIYSTICIGTQEWLSENLAETRFRNGQIIPFEGVNSGYFTNAEWSGLTSAAVCAYNNDLGNVGCNFAWPEWDVILEFYTYSPSSTTFDPVMSNTSGEFKWTVSGVEYTGSTLSVTLDGNNRKVRLYGRTGPRISTINISNDHVLGVLDFTHPAFSGFTAINIGVNPALTSLLFNENSSGSISSMIMNNLGIIGNLDLTMFNSYTGIIQIFRNSGMTSIDFSSSLTATTVSSLILHENISLSGGLDLSRFNSFSNSANIWLSSNTNMTGVTFASNVTGLINQLLLQSTGIVGGLDLSMFSGFTSSATLWLGGNNSMTGITFANPVIGGVGSLYIDQCSILKNVDISMFNNYSNVNLFIHSNPLMENLTFPTSINGLVNGLILHTNGSLSYLDLSMISGFTNNVQVSLYNCNKLTGITFWSDMIGSINFFSLYSSGIIGTLNLSGMNKFSTGASIVLSSNSGMTSINFNNTISGSIKTMGLINNNLTSLNLSGFTSFITGSTFEFYGNTGLTSITLGGSISGTFTRIHAYGLGLSPYFSPLAFLTPTSINGSSVAVADNNWSAAQVNQFLHELDSVSVGGFTGRSVSIGGNNSDPDSSSGGYDGLAAKSSLEVKGFTVNT
jgi:uncharacterized protein (TIGR02145 family)